LPDEFGLVIGAPEFSEPSNLLHLVVFKPFASGSDLLLYDELAYAKGFNLYPCLR
jgi:hypothetical protein